MLLSTALTSARCDTQIFCLVSLLNVRRLLIVARNRLFYISALLTGSAFTCASLTLFHDSALGDACLKLRSTRSDLLDVSLRRWNFAGLIEAVSRIIANFGMSLCPNAQIPQKWNNALPHRRQFVFHVRRNDVVNLSSHQAVSLQASQGLGQHFRGHLPDRALNFIRPKGAGCKQVEYCDSPLAAEQLNGIA